MKDAYIKECFKADGVVRFFNLVQAYTVLKIRPKYIFGSPVMVIIEPTNHCTLRCEMCVRPKLGSLKIGSMTYENFVYVLDQFPFAINLGLVGLGEPYLNKDLFRIIDYAKKVKKIGYVWLSSNGMVLREVGYANVMSSSLDDVLISFDAAEKETYEKIRVGADFSVLLENIRALTDLRRSEGKGPKIILATVASDTNVEELFKIVRMAGSLRVDKLLMFTVNSDFPNSKEMIFKDSSIQEKRLKHLASSLHLPFEYSKYTGCFEPWLRPYITWDGYVTPCASRPNAEEINFGNIFEQPFEEIWNSEEFQAFRLARPLVCRRCPRRWN